MNGVDNILQRILDEAKIAADETVEQAELSAKDILDDYESKGQFARGGILRASALEAEEEEKRMCSLANLEGRKLQLQTRQALLTEAFDRALAALCALPPADYAAVMCQWLLPQIKTGSEKVTLFVQGEARGLFEKVLAEKLKALGKPCIALAFDQREEGGFLLQDGDVEMNCTFRGLLQESRDELEQLLAKELF